MRADCTVVKHRDAECKGWLSEREKNALLTSFATMRITSLCIFALPPNVTLGAIQSQGQIVASHWRNLTYSVLQLYLYYCTMARISRVKSLQLSTLLQRIFTSEGTGEISTWATLHLIWEHHLWSLPCQRECIWWFTDNTNAQTARDCNKTQACAL